MIEAFSSFPKRGNLSMSKFLGMIKVAPFQEGSEIAAGFLVAEASCQVLILGVDFHAQIGREHEKENE